LGKKRLKKKKESLKKNKSKLSFKRDVSKLLIPDVFILKNKMDLQNKDILFIATI